MGDTVDSDLQPTLLGRTLSIRPLRAEDLEVLYAAASDPAIWEQHPEPTRYQRTVFEGFFKAALASRGALLVTDRATGAVIGSSRYYDNDPAARSVAIGYTFLARRYWGGAANRELKQLMLDHAFRWADTVWFHVGRDNLRSRRAMEKIGAELACEARREMNGVASDYVYYRIVRPG
jgi:N-acetyltransferase